MFEDCWFSIIVLLVFVIVRIGFVIIFFFIFGVSILDFFWLEDWIDFNNFDGNLNGILLFIVSFVFLDVFVVFFFMFFIKFLIICRVFFIGNLLLLLVIIIFGLFFGIFCNEDWRFEFILFL